MRLTALLAAIGYKAGQDAVDLVLLIDKYATAASLTLLATAAPLPFLKRLLNRRTR